MSLSSLKMGAVSACVLVPGAAGRTFAGPTNDLYLGTSGPFRHLAPGTGRERRAFFHICKQIALPVKRGHSKPVQHGTSTRNCKRPTSRSKGRTKITSTPAIIDRISRIELEDALTDLSSPRRPASLARQLALAVALASGTAVLAVPGFVRARDMVPLV